MLEVSGDGVKSEHSTDDANLTQFLMKVNGAENRDDQKSTPKAPVRSGRGLRRAANTVKIVGEDRDIKHEAFQEEKPKKKRTPRMKKVFDTSKDVLDKVDELIDASGNVSKERKKKHPYGLTPG